jgi:hypothetical protein
MGRYIYGDIESKLWFGVQSSDDADFFGVTGYQPDYLEYEFEKEDLESVREGLKKCEEELKDYKDIIEKFFKSHKYFNDKDIEKAGYDVKVFNDKLKWYARYELGKDIEKCIMVNGQCYFKAEL